MDNDSEPANSITPGRAEQDGAPRDRIHAIAKDLEDPLRHLRDEFWVPMRTASNHKTEPSPCLYFAGHAMGLQPRTTRELIQHHLDSWAAYGAGAAVETPPGSPLLPWGLVDDAVAKQMAHIVGAQPSETVVMGSTTTNLHLLMGAFYRPDGAKCKVIMEKVTFSSDYIAVESQMRWHRLDPAMNMIFIESTPLISTSKVLAAINQHAGQTALVLLSGVQYLTGQLLDIPTITAHAHSQGLMVGWDLAHAVGNVDLRLHDWGVDFAVWCNYKYMNNGPGTIGGAFVHEKHGAVDYTQGVRGYMPRLAGWWGVRPEERFKMETKFVPTPGAAGFQVSNNSILEMTALSASLSVFNKTSMADLRRKSVLLTGYLENLLKIQVASCLRELGVQDSVFEIVTPSNPNERGAQLSLRIEPRLLEMVFHGLQRRNIVVDIRKPDIMRVTPVPLYNTFTEVFDFVDAFECELRTSVEALCKANK
ncbi:pyridoxal phosphate-dependent transferase [Xylogone sp. PMI_703]|nr:pyridoxal phosphate-dependent transferase [Xylogone sp. PMI_703]